MPSLGLLDTIPRNLLFDAAPVDPLIWESSRVFVSDLVPACDRLRVQMQLIHEMVISARALGSMSVIGIIPEHSPRLARRVGLDCVPIGPVMDAGGLRSVAVSINMLTKMH
jgi:N-acyl-L-homoserine lactone synthetase